MCTCGSVYMSAGAYGEQRHRITLELQVVLSYLIWVPGAELRSSAKAVPVLLGQYLTS